MVTIKLTTNQKGRLVRLLKYTKNKVDDDVFNLKMYPGEDEYTKAEIEMFIKILNGEKKVQDDYLDVASKKHREKGNINLYVGSEE